MVVYGKKQIDIREDNKSAVIDILLHEESTMLQMSEQLKLSHTALAKVIKELTQKNIVRLIEKREMITGRPPKVYGINEDCAVACSVIVTQKNIYVYYVDMRGFQINMCECANTFAELAPLLEYVKEQVKFLKSHPRLHDKILKYIYVGIPTADFYGYTFDAGHAAVLDFFRSNFPDINTFVRSNIDCEMVAEQKYGTLKNSEKNAVLLNLDDYLCASFYLNGGIYCGEHQMQGYGGKSFRGLNGFSPPLSGWDKSEKNRLKEYLGEELSKLSGIMRFLDIEELIFSGEACRLGENFLALAKQFFPDPFRLRFSTMGKTVPAALSGAVWLSTYSTLQAIMIRS